MGFDGELGGEVTTWEVFGERAIDDGVEEGERISASPYRLPGARALVSLSRPGRTGRAPAFSQRSKLEILSARGTG